jgi:phage shock protein C
MNKRKKLVKHNLNKPLDVKSNDMHQAKRLYRSKNNQMVAGVCAGLGDYFAIDSTVIRLIFVLATVFGGFGIPVYIVLWIILPEVESGKIGSEETVKMNVAHMQAKAEGFAAGLRTDSNEGRTRFIFGLILIGLGVVYFLDNFGFFRADIF